MTLTLSVYRKHCSLIRQNELFTELYLIAVHKTSSVHVDFNCHSTDLLVVRWIVCADFLVLLAVIAASLPLTRGLKISIGSTVEEIMNTCMDGRNHKTKPGPESKLFQHVSDMLRLSRA